MREGSKKVSVGCSVSSDGKSIEFFLMSLDDNKLSPQNIIDALGDYLITDPAGLFQSDF